MKLINIISLWFLGITLAALLIGTIVIYEKLGSEIDFELGMELDRQIESYAQRIEQGAPVEKLQYDKLQIQELPMDWPTEELWLRDTLAYHDPMNRNETQLKASRSFKIDGKHYRISYYNLVVEADDITETIVLTMLTVFLAQLLFIGFFLWAISKKIFRPFHTSLEQLQQFSFQKNTPLKLTKSGVYEFDLLNTFLEKMSTKLLKDYRKIKEFSENLSHEIQTPSAVVRGKLELLMNESINEQQAALIQAAFDSNERIRRIVKSLAILAKLENEEFESPEPMDFSEGMQQMLSRLEEVIHMHDLHLKKDIQPGVILQIHPYVAEILIHNLLTNAIKHNVDGGEIDILMDESMLQIRNSGKSPSFDPKEMLGRFKKDGEHQDSVGLGLAIVNQICKNYGFTLRYTFDKPFHSIQVQFR
ncbi:HAMP domain-containing sensor histidine kinase [Algoriphagus halophytocola]|uniref:histidine kinase n=1 Tax=Algoriphagus halophytocola TaxID=2991499 RepID=A0ABY6MLQ4_9BACT|nr:MULTISPECIES: HAMP domain-containing sensor histidine kinase [unclassified Algoriphagus]UZD23216.1 HAMP domain-containing histidine kinase [Algoriphagus sp. TR-M5]WBL44509.1 HAMP domain-containing sensor histidine kinase [Algoriphagus sp. TR-M9]